MAKTVGVLGGMGPYATAAFFGKLLTLTPARKDWEHLRIVVDNNPHIPSRSRHLLFGEPSPLAAMLESCKSLERYPVDLIALPCNSAATFIPALRTRIGVPILNIIEITVAALVHRSPAPRQVIVFGSHVTYSLRSYEPYLRAHGLTLADHGPQVQHQVELLIERLKLTPDDCSLRADLSDLMEHATSVCGQATVVLACTEFGCLPGFVSEADYIDSSLALAEETVRLAT